MSDKDKKQPAKITVPGGGAPPAASLQGSDAPIPWASLFVLIAGGFMAILDSSIVNVALAKLMAIFGVGTEKIQWVMTSYLLVSGVVIPVTGYLGDRFGFKRMYIYSMVVFTIGSALCALAWSNSSLVAFRVVQAAGGGMMIPISMAMLYRIVPMNKIGTAMGVWGITAMLAPAIGPTAGGYLVDNFSWHTIFTINIPIGIVVVLLAGIVLEETQVRDNLKFDLPGFLLSSIGFFALLLAMSQGQEKGWSSQYIVTLLIFAFFTLLLFILWELYTPQPMLNIKLLRNPVFAAAQACVGILTIGLFAAIFIIPIYAQTLMGLTPMQTGLLLLPMALASGVMMPISGMLFDKVGAFPLAVVGMAILIITTYELRLISMETNYHWLQHLLVIRAAAMGLMMMPITTAAMKTLPPMLSGPASAMNNLVRQICASLGIAFLTWVMIKRQAFHAAVMADNISLTHPMAGELIHQATQNLAATGGPISDATATGLLTMTVQQQAMATAMGDTFIVSTVIIVLALPTLIFLTQKRVTDQQQSLQKTSS